MTSRRFHRIDGGRRQVRVISGRQDGEGEIGRLPDDVLISIFSLLPTKSIARIAAVCKRWHHVYHLVQNVDMTNNGLFPSEQSDVKLDEIVGAVSLFLRIHRLDRKQSFGITFEPPITHLPQVYNWIDCLVKKGIEKLDLDFCINYRPLRSGEEEKEVKKLFTMPPCLFESTTITHLNIVHSDFTVPDDFSGLKFLTHLHLFDVNITDEMLDRMVNSCSLLEEIELVRCSYLKHVRICGRNLQLKSLTFLDTWIEDLDLSTPNLESFHFSGNFEMFEINEFPIYSLVDAIICTYPPRGYEFDYFRLYLLVVVSNVELLTLAIVGIVETILDESVAELLPITFNNLIELQILLPKGIVEYSVICGYFDLFSNCLFPSLEKLFIELDNLPFNSSLGEEGMLELELPTQVLIKLKTVKIKNFHGYTNEIGAVEFLLQSAIILESLFLVAPGGVEDDDNSASLRTSLNHAVEELSIFPKASSFAQIVLCNYGEEDSCVATHEETQWDLSPSSP